MRAARWCEDEEVGGASGGGAADVDLALVLFKFMNGG